MIHRTKKDEINEEKKGKNYVATEKDFLEGKDEEHIASPEDKEELDRNTREANTKPDKDKIW